MKDGKLTEIKNKPEILSIVINGDDDSVALKWCPAVGADKYVIQRKTPDEEKFKKVGATKVSVTEFTDKTVPGEGEYSYRIVARKTVKDEDPKTKKSPAETVTIVHRPSVSFEKVETDKTGKVTLSWKKAPDVDGYVIYRRYSFMTKPIDLAVVEEDVCRFVDDSTVKGQHYYYSIRSFLQSENGKNYSAHGDETSVVLLDTPFLLSTKRLHRKRVRFSFRLSSGADGYAAFKSDSEDGDYPEAVRTEGKFVFECTDCAEKGVKGAYYRFACYKTVGEQTVFGEKTKPVFIKYKV